jgi:hypothetical protein
VKLRNVDLLPTLIKQLSNSHFGRVGVFNYYPPQQETKSRGSQRGSNARQAMLLFCLAHTNHMPLDCLCCEHNSLLYTACLPSSTSKRILHPNTRATMQAASGAHSPLVTGKKPQIISENSFLSHRMNWVGQNHLHTL